MKQRFFTACASLLAAIANCEKTGNTVWRANHTDKLARIVKEYAPSGSGFDNGTTLDMDRSNAECLRFNTAFHHMDEHGGYDGWTNHSVTVRASLAHGVVITVHGRDRNSIKDYIAEQFHYLYSLECES